MDYKKISNVTVGGIDYSDYPDFCDAYIESADYNGVAMDEEQLDKLNEDKYFVHDCLLEFIS